MVLGGLEEDALLAAAAVGAAAGAHGQAAFAAQFHGWHWPVAGRGAWAVAAGGEQGGAEEQGQAIDGGHVRVL